LIVVRTACATEAVILPAIEHNKSASIEHPADECRLGS
jgi:hypothetical protein